MKTLPTLRDKKRYMAFEVMSEQVISRAELSHEIFASACSLFGDAGCSDINSSLLSYDGKYGIVRCAKGKTKEIRAALACISKVRGTRISILTLWIAVTIKGAMEKFIQQTLINKSEPDKEDKQ